MKYREIQLPKRYFFNRTLDDPTDFQVVSFDTETLNGYCRLLADSDRNFIFTSYWREIMEFLTRRELHKPLKTFYNLDYDARSIIKYLPVEVQHDLYYTNSADYDGVTIRWLPGKVFTIKRKNRNYSYYDIAQFYGGTLEANARRYLTSYKGTYQVTNLTEDDFREDNREIVDYCIQDCTVTKKLTELQRDKVHKLGISFYRPISKANLSERFTIKHVKIPRPTRNSIQELAFYSYAGGRFELLQRGYFPYCYCYDINSAYPNVIKELPNPFDCLSYTVDDYDRDARIGYYDITIEDLAEPYASPLVHEYRGINVFPNGENIRRVVSQPEMEYIRRHVTRNYEVNRAYCLYEKTDARPFSFITDLYRLRKETEAEDPVFAKTIKIIMNSLYGKFWQVTKLLDNVTHDDVDADFMVSNENVFRLYKKKYKAGYFFNPVFASHITASTRIQLLETAHAKLKNVIGFHTDSIITTEPFIKEREGLGNWSLEHEGEGVFLGTGMYTIRNPEHIKHRRRGGTAKNITSWFDVIESNGESNKIMMDISHVVTLGDVFNFPNVFTLEDLNKFQSIRRTVSVDNDIKRTWHQKPGKFSELLEGSINSEPLVI